MGREHIPLIERADSLEKRNQILTVSGIILSLFANGNVLGFSSISLPSLITPDSSESISKVSKNDLSWIASLVLVGCFFGTLIGGLVSDVIGRKKTIILGSLIYAVGWILISQSVSVAELEVGRVLTGLASGFYTSTVQVYICEIVEPSLRGISGSLPTLMVSIGILWIYCSGALMEWRTVAICSSIFPIFVLAYVIFIPESPVWLISQGRTSDALHSLGWLRNNLQTAEEECNHLQFLKERRTTFNMRQRYNMRHYCSRIFSKSILKPFAIGVSLFFFQQFAGIYPITFYATLIFNYSDDNMNDYLETVAIGFVRMFFTVLGIFLVNFINRRPLLIASGLLMSFSTGTLGTFFLLRENYHWQLSNSTFAAFDLTKMDIIEGSSIPYYHVEWIPLTTLLIFMVGYSIGFGIIPWFFVAEIMPSDVRSLSCSMAFAFNHIFLFTTVKTFIWSMSISSFGTFFIFSGVALVGVLFVFTFVPETFNLQTGEIEELFDSNKRKGLQIDPDEADELFTPL